MFPDLDAELAALVLDEKGGVGRFLVQSRSLEPSRTDVFFGGLMGAGPRQLGRRPDRDGWRGIDRTPSRPRRK